MQLSQIKVALEFSRIEPVCFVTQSVLDKGLSIVVLLGDQALHLTTSSGHDRVFKSADSAIRTAYSLGVSEVRVDAYAVNNLS